MKNIKIIIIGSGYCNIYQPNIKIYKEKELIYDGYTYNGELELCLEENSVYKLIGTLNNRIIKIAFYVDKNINKYIFNFFSIKRIIFLLTDFNYKNLPIKKGEILL